MTSTDTPAERIHFAPGRAFLTTLKTRVEAHFNATGQAQTGNFYLYAKAAFSLSLYLGGYITLLTGPHPLWMVIIAAFITVQGAVLLAFNVMHDGAHGSFSRSRHLNWIMGAAMDLLGSSNMLWRQKHNMLHHTYTNISGKDDDIDIGALMRFAPSQTWKPWHRLQHWYAPILYSLLTMYLMVYSDFQRIFSGKIGTTPMQKLAPWELFYFYVTRVAYVILTLVVPLFFFPAWQVFSVFVGCQLLFGLTISLIFQLAHTVEGTAFPVPQHGHLEDEWAVHQVRTTANFAPNNLFITFYAGGLNFQIEHHLFHKISHVHYPAISHIVRETCAEFNVPYLSFPSVGAAISAHFRFLKRMGIKPAEPTIAV